MTLFFFPCRPEPGAGKPEPGAGKPEPGAGRPEPGAGASGWRIPPRPTLPEVHGVAPELPRTTLLWRLTGPPVLGADRGSLQRWECLILNRYWCAREGGEAFGLCSQFD